MACKVTAVMTTIHIPVLLRDFRALGPDVEFIVVGDKKTPPEAGTFCQNLGARFISAAEQERLGYACSDYIGWNCIQRRTIGILEALKSKPDILYQFDDDNRPVNPMFFDELRLIFDGPAWVDVVSSENGWFNLGEYANQPYYYRGYPYSLRNKDPRYSITGSMERIGIFNSLIYGDPDINATERIEQFPNVVGYIPALKFFAPAPGVWSPLDTQSTAYRKQFAPLAFVLPGYTAGGVGRYDDIWAGYIAQYIMRQTDYVLAYGLPAVKQERHPHNLFKDLKDELMGMEWTERFIQDLEGIDVSHHTIPQALQHIAEALNYESRPYPFPVDFLRAYARDLERVL